MPGLALADMLAPAMTRPNQESETPLEAASPTSMILSVGFCLGSVAPSLVGIARDVSGRYTQPFVAFAATAGTMALLSALPGRLDSDRPEP